MKMTCYLTVEHSETTYIKAFMQNKVKQLNLKIC